MNYLTEDQAAEKWCPQSRVMTGDLGKAAGNRPFDVHSSTQCVGSACMMWRWQIVTIDKDGNVITSREHMRRVAAGERSDDFKPAWGNTGYCGLAGNPG